MRQKVDSPSLRLPQSPNLAFTLVELLVVIAILSIVTVASIPLLLPALNSRPCARRRES